MNNVNQREESNTSIKRKREGKNVSLNEKGTNVRKIHKLNPEKAVSAHSNKAVNSNGSNKIKLNFQAEYNDHFESPTIAYKDISSILDKLAVELGKTKSNLILYDPYFCQGKMVKYLNELGFNNVINLNKDFYEEITNKTIPDFDMLITNPPYSGEHKQKLLKFILNKRVIKPFALLLPIYTATKSYWKEFVTALNKKMKVQNSCAYFLPCNSYSYDHPEGTGHKLPPFYSAWFIGGISSMESVLSYLCEKTGAKRSCTGISGSVTNIKLINPVVLNSVDELALAGFVSGEKRPNPKSRKRRKLK